MNLLERSGNTKTALLTDKVIGVIKGEGQTLFTMGPFAAEMTDARVEEILSLVRSFSVGQSLSRSSQILSILCLTSSCDQGWTEGQKFIFFPVQLFQRLFTFLTNPTILLNFLTFLSSIFWDFYIFVSKIKSFGKNFILAPGFMVNPFVFLSVFWPVLVLWFTPETYLRKVSKLYGLTRSLEISQFLQSS